MTSLSLPTRRCEVPKVQEIVDTLKKVFKVVQYRPTQADIDGWPQGANHMFGYASALIQRTGMALLPMAGA